MGEPAPGHLLMVDNNPGDILLARIAMEEAALPAELHAARDGKEGQALLQAVIAGAGPRFQLVLLDLNMPRMDGRKLLGWCRGQPELAALPIIIVTSSPVPADRSDCLALGATEFWIKPSDFDDYVRRMAGLRRYFTG